MSVAVPIEPICRTLLLLGLLIGLNSFGLGHSVSAQETYPNVRRGRPPNPKAFPIAQRALAAFKAGDFTTATQLVKQAITMDSGNKEYFMLLALCQAESGNSMEADVNFRSAINLDSNWVQCRNNYAVFLKKQGKLDAAKNQLTACFHIKPDYADPYFHMGEIKQQQGDLDGAIEDYQTAVNLKPELADAQQALGLAMYQRTQSGRPGEMGEAVEKLEQAVKYRPNDPIIHYHLAMIYCSDGRLDQAEKEYRTALSFDPQFAACHFEFGRLRYYRGDLDRCLIEMKAAAGISPAVTEQKKEPAVDIARVRMYISTASELKGRLPEAIDAMKEVASMQKNNAVALKHIKDLEKAARSNARKHAKEAYDPEQIQTLLNQGVADTENGDTENARSVFQRVLVMDPRNFEATQNIGFLMEAAGDLNGAMTQYRKASEFLPDYDGAYYNMGYLLEKLGLPADAGMMYQKFHEIAGSYPYDPKHIVSLQQEDARERAKREEFKKRGY
jgi:Flp pilus assembly protein TadD